MAAKCAVLSLCRAVVEAVHRLDLILGNKAAYQEVFKPENISLRNKLRELCVKLMFLHPVDYGRKAEELLWRKVYYEVIQLIKTNKKHIHSRSALECAYRTHLVAGIGFYQHLLLYIQSHYQLELQCCIDWTHVTDPLMGCKKPVSASEKEMEWAQMACHRCLVYLGDLGKRASSGEGTLVCRKSGHSAGLPPTAGVLSDAFVGDRRGRSVGFALHAAVAPWVLRTASLSFSAVCLDGVWCRMAAEAEMFCIGPPWVASSCGAVCHPCDGTAAV
ncbi:protein SMG5-like [Lagopus leucura]|uniref:protein SMG5-like n=1 Tax=Lagopus leucura TaxID=30410 RepID=UPI001C668BFE|nr:protein SMG5-like [Lagopus leucura]